MSFTLNKSKEITSAAKDSHYAKLRRNYRDRKKLDHKFKIEKKLSSQDKRLLLYGIHTVGAAINNPKRQIFRLLATRNALANLNYNEHSSSVFPIQIVSPREIDNIVGKDTAHQGVLLETLPLKYPSFDIIRKSKLLIVLDQVNDPHNVGAILRSAVAFKCDAIITTKRHIPDETSVLAKSASGALEHIPYIRIGNLAEALQKIHSFGFQTIGLSSDSDIDLEESFCSDKIALVLGSEGKGLRKKTQETVNVIAQINMPGEIKSLNVSNASALSLYIVQNHFKLKSL
ncbi:23S rRNA (guanosine(2251)-2'-O)-methyltransferase RlmB [Candidatus Liberibacter americanus]|uniref:rRNA methylase n=1 Tax=Candidatus Liberibacter americanus str. Sao Paulo TaxID=1261131 RepID=U6B9F7_9HYPH|nr:23S rRNA (guanosine(2251)-2'-O)-methyltransferase RlmB [Candidatus Liberibacter americanus]AHA28352.1 rRNA methylase [Candidatus Liberibacter americanus str. Sao Paulo]EMS36642.1 tRNA/rRNA methyltransferase protein [Candidatus Liberibacter americanus PW_SP]